MLIISLKYHPTDFQDQLTVQNQKQIQGKSTMEIKHATPSDSGFYLCVASNGISTIKTNGIAITVCGKHFLKSSLNVLKDLLT